MVMLADVSLLFSGRDSHPLFWSWRIKETGKAYVSIRDGCWSTMRKGEPGQAN